MPRLLLAAGLSVCLGGSLAAAQPLPAPAAPPAAPAAPASPATAGAGRPLIETLSGMAKAEYEGGRVLYADRDYQNAIIKFEKAHELAGDPRLLWNIAVCEKNLRRYSRMLRTVRRYQTEAAAVLSGDEQRQAAEIVKTVESFVSALYVTSNEAGAAVFVDDDQLGTTPLAEPIMIDVGKRRIRLVKPGFHEAVVTPEVIGGGELRIDIPMEKEVHRGRLNVAAGADDVIAVDGQTVGRATWDGSLSTGGHTLRVTAPGMAPYQSEVVIADEAVRHVDVSLTPAARTDTTRNVLWIVGGVVLAAGATIGGYYLFKPQEAAKVEGTLSPGMVQLSTRPRSGITAGTSGALFGGTLGHVSPRSPFAFTFGGAR